MCYCFAENKGKRFNTDKMFEFKIEERFRAFYLRVGFTRKVDHSMEPLINTLPMVVCKTFLPLKTAHGAYENIVEVLERVAHEVKSSGLSK